MDGIGPPGLLHGITTLRHGVPSGTTAHGRCRTLYKWAQSSVFYASYEIFQAAFLRLLRLVGKAFTPRSFPFC